jgi:four helix bundle protein
LAESDGRAVQVYRVAADLPTKEHIDLTAPITRTGASVPANIAEGHARISSRDFAHFLSIAKGSSMETAAFLALATRLGYMSEEQSKPTQDPITEVSKMLTVLRNRLKESRQ